VFLGAEKLENPNRKPWGTNSQLETNPPLKRAAPVRNIKSAAPELQGQIKHSTTHQDTDDRNIVHKTSAFI
jgi:hypothetical protein